MNADRSVKRCSIYFGILAFVVAGMIGLAQESWALSILVGLSVIVGYLYTDVLKWFSLHRFLVYIMMITGAAVAVGQFMSDSGANRLLAVGNLLIYVQLPLIFQQKSKRVFEQWGVFLLLELVVAALVNDNVLYGILMLPVLALGCAAMMSLAQYSSHLKHNESQSESMGLLSRWMHWIGRESTSSSAKSGISLAAVEPMASYGAMPAKFAGARWDASIMPMSLSILLFSVGYFYTLPRLQVGAYQAENWASPSVGFSEQISLRFQGDLRQNETPMFRMKMFDETTGKDYRPSQPPYIRLTVLHRYIDGPSKGLWQKGESAVIVDPRYFRKVPNEAEIRDELIASSDKVIVSIIEKNTIGEPAGVIPPFAYAPQPKDLYLIRRDWRLIDSTDESRSRSIKRRYSFRTYGFRQGEERLLLPESFDTIEDDFVGAALTMDRLYRRDELLDFPISLNPILAFRESVFQNTKFDPTDKVSRALYLERYLATSNDFSYSLRITPPVNPRMDPIADFLLNKRKGHCEYFASSLAMLLRSMNIPTRIVSGFRPSEYNEVGRYFQVQQKHAHVWVEAYFTAEQLRRRTFSEPIPDWVTGGMWLRLDPTPGGDGSNAQGAFRATSGQTLSVMQDLWTEMILNMDKTRQSSMLSIFAETSEGSYDAVWLQLQSLLNRLQSSRFIGGLMSPERWFSWRAAVAIGGIGASIVLLHRMMLWLVPQWTPRLSLRRKRHRLSKVDFYNRAVKALRRLGLERANWQTPREFMLESSAHLAAKNLKWEGSLIADCFYDVRFGNESVDQATRIELERQLASIEGARA